MLTIQDDVFVSLKIDDQEVEYAGLQNITLCEGNGVLCPTMSLDLADPKSLLASSHTLSEGNKVEILIARSMKDNRVGYRKYRVFGPIRANNALNPTVKFVAILNSPKFVSASVQESYEGTTDAVLKQLASRCDMTFSGPQEYNGRQMNDRQSTWLNICKNRQTFLSETVRHGWMDQHSGMSATVTSYGEIRYRNLIDVINTPEAKIQFVFTHNARYNSNESHKKTYLVKEAHDKSTAGFMASAMNYGSTRVHNSLDGKPKQITSLAVKTPGSYLALNKEVADMIKKSRYDYAPIDCGNTHEQFQDAVYQNMKILALFTEKMSLLVTEVTEVQLYDVVVYRQADADLNAPVRNTDIYLVVGKTLVIRSGIHYAERLELARMSLTMEGQAQLQGPGNVASERSMIPDISINRNSMGTSLASQLPGIKNIASLNGVVADSFHTLESLQGLANRTVSQVGSAAAELSNAISSGLGITDAIGGLANSSLQMLAHLNSLSGISQLIGDSTGQLIPAISSLPQAMRITTLSQAAGVLPAIGQQILHLAQYSRVGSVLDAAVSAIPIDLREVSDAMALAEAANQTKNLVMVTSEHVSNQWNSSVLCMQGQKMPTAIQQTNLPTRLDTLMQTRSMTDSQLHAFLQQESLRTNSTSANLLPTNAFATPTAVSTLDSALRPLTNMIQRFEA